MDLQYLVLTSMNLYKASAFITQETSKDPDNFTLLKMNFHRSLNLEAFLSLKFYNFFGDQARIIKNLETFCMNSAYYRPKHVGKILGLEYF